MRTWTDWAYQVEARYMLTHIEEPRWCSWMRASRSNYRFSNEYDDEMALARAKARMQKLQKEDDDPREVVEYRIVKLTKTTTKEEVVL